MPKYAGPPLRKVTLNLYDEDVEWFTLVFGQGWSTAVRELVHDYIVKQRTEEPEYGE